jgi:hypothetical protein
MPDAGARIKVPVAEIMVEAYRGVFGGLGAVLDVAWLPLLLVLAATLLPGYVRIYSAALALPAWAGDRFGLTFENLIEAIVALLALNAFAVRWYQSLLYRNGPRVPPGIFLGAWLRFLLYTLLLYLIATLLLVAMLLANSEGAPAYLAPLAGMAMFVMWLAPLRCSLLFPAAATGQPLTLAAAWRAMGGNTWRLFAAVMLVTLPTVFVAAMLINGIFNGLNIDASSDAPPPVGFFILRGVLGTCADFLVVALSAAVVAGFYRRVGAKAD